MQWNIGKPNTKQIAFFKARTRFVAYGGARGGGKSWAVRKKSAGLALSYNGISILILRRTFPELRENHILPMIADLMGIARYRDMDKSFTFPNGSRIVFGYCDSEADVLQYQGQEYDVIFMDEATQFTEFQFTTLTACLRGANDFPKRFYLTCNPGGVGHTWVKRLFIDKQYKASERPEDYLFIAANVYDNHALMEHDPDYVRMLENLPEEQRKAWLLGQWDIFEGQYFAEFDRDIHVCRPHGIPAHWRRYVTLDYGMDMLAALWMAVDEQGRAVVYRELYEGRDNGKGENGQGHIISAAARRLLEVNGGDEVQAWLAPPDLWNRRQDTGKSAAELFLENGVPLTKTGNSRVAGWLAVREFLAPGPGGQARGGEATRAQARDRARRFCVQNRVENEEASIRARKLQKATTAKQRCGAAKPGPRSRRPHRGISRSEMPRPILRGKPKRRKGRTRPFRLRRSGTRPKGGRRGAPPRRTLTPPVHRARRSCCRRRRARPYRCWCGPWTTKTPRCPSGWTRQRPYWTAYTARPRSPSKGTAAPRYRS